MAHVERLRAVGRRARWTPRIAATFSVASLIGFCFVGFAPAHDGGSGQTNAHAHSHSHHHNDACECPPPPWELPERDRPAQSDLLDIIAEQNEKLRVNPNDGWSRYVRGSAFTYLPQPKYEDALVDFFEASRLCPNMAELFVARARVFRRLNRKARAIADYAEALRLDPCLDCIRAERDAFLKESAGESEQKAQAQDPASASAEGGNRVPSPPQPNSPNDTNWLTTLQGWLNSLAPRAQVGAEQSATSANDKTPESELTKALRQAAIEEANARAERARADADDARAVRAEAQAKIEEARIRAARARVDLHKHAHEQTSGAGRTSGPQIKALEDRIAELEANARAEERAKLEEARARTHKARFESAKSISETKKIEDAEKNK